MSKTTYGQHHFSPQNNTKPKKINPKQQLKNSLQKKREHWPEVDQAEAWAGMAWDGDDDGDGNGVG